MTTGSVTTTVPTTLAPATTPAATTTTAPTRADLLADIALYQTAITAAEAVISSPAATRVQISAARVTVSLMQAEVAETNALLAPQSPRVVTVRVGDTLPLLSQRYYGDHTRTGFSRIQMANNLVGLAIQPGMVLVIPTG